MKAVVIKIQSKLEKLFMINYLAKKSQVPTLYMYYCFIKKRKRKETRTMLLRLSM